MAPYKFDVVILLNVRDGIWPSRNAQTPAEKEAERRVFYVAFTRAKQKGVMLIDERTGNSETVASLYIAELGLEL